jgi:glycosyltransferase involved in cell wall biosynthesis
MPYRIFHATGPGNIIQAHKHWSEGQHDPTEVSITFSSQFEEFCLDVKAEAYITAYHSNKKTIYRDGAFTLEHRPKPMPGAKGMRYHLAEILYGLGLFLTALRFRANAAVLDSGVTHFFVLSLFRMAGIKPIIVLHNTLWPSGFPPTRLVPRIIAKLDSLFFRWIPAAIIGVSPECIRQVQQLTNGKHPALYQMRAQFHREYFAAIAPSPTYDQHPFRIMFIGRIVRFKGVFDILEMAKRVEIKAPGRVRWEICGSGPDHEELKQLQHKMGLKDIVFIRGWTPLKELRDVYARSHVFIVPTRSSFCEGLPMTAAEAVLAERPLITNPVVPALEILRPACLEAQTENTDSYVKVILKLIDDPILYRALCQACPDLQRQFYDREQGLRGILKKILSPKIPADDRTVSH